jgi:phenylalanyl-tRNA synthetase beta chain
MKVPLSWLKEYLDLTISPVAIAKTLTMIGLEVEAVHSQSLSCRKVVVGRVLSVQKHPNADKLVLSKVSDGSSVYDVVCGAPNCREGMKTAFAVIGASLLDEEGKELKVKKSKIRGIESSGMLCSGKELGLSNDHDGILEFSDQVPEGADVAELYADHIFDVSLTPNLAHCASVLGIARELGAALEIPLRVPAFKVVEEFSTPASPQVSIKILNPTDCPRYAARLVTGVTIQPSPDWLRKKLEAAGLRSINNVVDAANYVLLELGHPLHTFDYDTLQGHKIIVRSARQGEKFVTLDGKERHLHAEDLLICDGDKPVAIAGIMGGANSEVTSETRNILIEAAYFNPSCIRKTSKRLGLSTDSSKRFERGSDPNGLHFALDRLTALIQELSQVQDTSQGKVAKIIEFQAREFLPNVIFCRKSRVNSILGTRLSVGEIESIFHRLGFTSVWDGQDLFTVTVPTYRVDLLKEIDLIEEVARFYGYDNIPRISGKAGISTISHAPIFLFEREVRFRLMAEGLQEFLTCDLIGPTLLNIVQDHSFDDESIVKVLNPTSIEQSVLRTSFLPGLLGVVKYNIDHQNHDISGFEVGRIHFKEGDQYKEQSVAGIIMTGKKSPHHWDIKPAEADFYDLKGVVENILTELRIPDVRFVSNNCSTLHPGRQASIFSGSFEIGSLGEVHPAIQKRLDVNQRILFAELNLHDMFRVRTPEQKLQALPIFPSSERDWTLTLNAETLIDDVLMKIRCIPSDLLEKVYLLDMYRSDKLGRNKMNATFHFVYRDKQKTIEQETVDAEHNRIVEEVLHLLKNVSIQNHHGDDEQR